MVSEIDALLRPDLRGRTAYGAPQLDLPVTLNTNENSYAVPAAVVDEIASAVAEIAPDSIGIQIGSSPRYARRWRHTSHAAGP